MKGEELQLKIKNGATLVEKEEKRSPRSQNTSPPSKKG